MKKIKVESGTKIVELAESLDEFDRYLSELEDDSLLTFDWETTGLEYNALPLGLAIHQLGKNPMFVPTDYFFTNGLPIEGMAEIGNRQFRRLRLMAHNAKYDSMINVMNGFRDENCNIVADSLIMVHLYDPNLDKQLEKRVKEDFGYSKKTFEEICGEKWAKINWNISGDRLLPLLAGYAGEDTYWETKVYHKYKKLLDAPLWAIHNNIEIPMVNILRDAKIRGVLIDVPLIEEMRDKCEKALVEAQKEIYDVTGCVFNLNSPKQKKEVFFDKMKLPIISYTKSGEPSTDANTYVEWADMGYDVGIALQKFSELGKLMSGYLKPIPNLVDEHNVLRGDLNSCGTRTGRFSSSNPNLQNQPNNHDFPIRDAFIPRPGYVFINYDYSQLELRVMAHLSKDAKFMEIFLNGGDPHGDVAKRCGITRKQAKVMNFGVLYGMGPDKYERSFGVTHERAVQMIEDYHTTYEGFAQWKTRTENSAKKNGYVRNLFGRIRRFSEVTKNPYSGKIDKRMYYGELRQSVNTLVQGTGADIVKRATVAMCREFVRRNLDAHFLLQVHDEVLIEARYDQMIEVEKVVIDAMENTTKLVVPLLADGKIISKWGEMKSDDTVSLPFRFDYSLYSGLCH